MELAVKLTSTIKFLSSYGGRILPRYPDGKLRYHGGETRVLSVERSISFSELLMKLGEMCGTSVVNLRCQLPTEDLDALVSITSDEDLANLIEEYDRVAPPPRRSRSELSCQLLKLPTQSPHRPLLHRPNRLIPPPLLPACYPQDAQNQLAEAVASVTSAGHTCTCTHNLQEKSPEKFLSMPTGTEILVMFVSFSVEAIGHNSKNTQDQNP